MSARSYFYGVAAAAMMAGASSGAYAQTAGDDASTVEVVIVTAERREQSLQEAPAAINVVSGATVEQLKIDSVTNLVSFVPGLKMDGNSKDQLRMGLRGAFSSADTPGTGQAVGVYIDGVFYAHTTDLGGKLFDVSQVEILRGPQGTLYGQNVVGGLINIVTRDPDQEFGAKAQVSFGRFNRRDISGHVTGPMSDTLSGSLSFYSTRSDGWQKNLTTGNRLDALDTFATRLKLVWRPNEDLTVRLIGEYSEDNTYGIVRNIVFGDPERYVVPDTIRETRNSVDGRYDRETALVAVTSDYDLGWATLSSITAYQDSNPKAIGASYVTDPVAHFTADRSTQSETFSQEVRLARTADRYRFQVGAFYLHDNISRFERFDVLAAPGTRFYDMGVRTNVTAWAHDMKARSFSLFGQGTYELNDVISVTAGARYTWDKKSSDFSASGEPNVTVGQLAEAPFRVLQDAKWSEFTPKLTIDAKWQDVFFLDQLMLYGTVSKGYIAGDLPGGSTRAAASIVVPPEKVLNFEGGFKTTFWNRRATFNLTAFDVDYRGLQTLSVDAAQQGVASTDANAYGFEWDFTVRPVEGLDLSVAYAWLRAKISEGARAPNGSLVGGNKVPQSPNETLNVLARYTRPIADDTDLRLTAAYTAKSGVWFDVRNNRAQSYAQTDQSNLDLEAAITRGRWEVSVWGKNVTNDHSLMRAFDLSRFMGLTTPEGRAGETLLDGVYAEPRTYGVTVRWEY